MPVARGPQINTRNALVIGFTAVVIAALLGAMALWAASQGSTEIVIGDRDFKAGKVEAISREIRDNGPILYSDVGRSRRQRDIIITHSGVDPEQGWLAFAARRATDPRDCFFSWDPEADEFFLTSAAGSSTSCDDVATDAKGTDLFQYGVEVHDGEIHVLLNQDPE